MIIGGLICLCVLGIAVLSKAFDESYGVDEVGF